MARINSPCSLPLSLCLPETYPLLITTALKPKPLPLNGAKLSVCSKLSSSLFTHTINEFILQLLPTTIHPSLFSKTWAPGDSWSRLCVVQAQEICVLVECGEGLQLSSAAAAQSMAEWRGGSTLTCTGHHPTHVVHGGTHTNLQP